MQGVYDHIDEITGKLKEKLVADKDVAFLSKQLATINTNCNINCKLEEFLYSFPFNKDVYNMFLKYQFNSLLRKKELFVESLESNEKIETEEILNIKQVLIDKLDVVSEIVKKAKQTKKIYLNLSENFSLFVDNTEYNLDSKIDLLSANVEVQDVLQSLSEVLLDE